MKHSLSLGVGWRTSGQPPGHTAGCYNELRASTLSIILMMYGLVRCYDEIRRKKGATTKYEEERCYNEVREREVLTMRYEEEVLTMRYEEERC